MLVKWTHSNNCALLRIIFRELTSGNFHKVEIVQRCEALNALLRLTKCIAYYESTLDGDWTVSC